MRGTVQQVLDPESDFWGRVEAQRALGPLLIRLVLFIVAASMLYGAVMAGWRSPKLAFYVALKMPVLLLGTTTLVMMLNWMIAGLFGAALSLVQVVALTWSAMAVASFLLLSLAPVALFFTLTSAAMQGTDAELQFTHNCLLVTHISLIALAGAAGNMALIRGLRRLVPPRCSLTPIYTGWVIAFAGVGCQLSWMLRPFVGSPFYPVAFMRPDALDRNFYEFVFGEVMPYILFGGR
ncbi:MAG TPA: hypothetical protein PKE12_02640 [Kiritimatiellia bacterium]|nr:hypothetical protein [Kiritimatiellia bacterium]